MTQASFLFIEFLFYQNKIFLIIFVITSSSVFSNLIPKELYFDKIEILLRLN